MPPNGVTAVRVLHLKTAEIFVTSIVANTPYVGFRKK